MLCCLLAQTYCYRVCMYAKALFCPQKNSLKSRGHSSTLRTERGLERTGSFKTSRNHQAPSTSQVSNFDCKLIGKGRVEQNERLLLFTKTMGTLCCSVAAARPVPWHSSWARKCSPLPSLPWSSDIFGANNSLLWKPDCSWQSHIDYKQHVGKWNKALREMNPLHEK